MNTIILKENVVSDDVVHIASKGKVFSGQLVAIVEYNTYLNEWNDRKHIRGFKTMKALHNFIDKKYKDIEVELFQEKEA